ncbi:IS66 family insertion sequence element accessory protein TnpB [Rhizobium sp. 007]|uniref:IS66 family insertion sequence element accessory protein TnpB n=1 Tax=Rhizobium sp. 007 TaxID=2785056 RepID=UPI00188EF275|nr:IS66 family insertion sequence element accessory protein TnpB [Rhizobium sp. 007]QPB24353.1 IS66 family insertion sequence element accessory protein TnpB [Rhizobium sp. 007]
MIVAGQRLPILIATRPVDFRCGHQALALMVQTELKLDPHSGATVIFRSKRGDRLKILVWDGTGIVLIYNDLHSYCISLSHSVEGFGVSGILLMRGDAIDELVPSTALLLR